MLKNRNSKKKIEKDIIDTIVTITKKYSSDVINTDVIKDSYKMIIPSNKVYTDEKKMIVFILIKEMIKKGAIKKGEYGSEIVEEILFIGEMINKKKSIIKIKKELLNEIDEFILIANENGFEKKLWKNKNEILAEDIYTDWMILCKNNVCIIFF